MSVRLRQPLAVPLALAGELAVTRRRRTRTCHWQCHSGCQCHCPWHASGTGSVSESHALAASEALALAAVPVHSTGCQGTEAEIEQWDHSFLLKSSRCVDSTYRYMPAMSPTVAVAATKRITQQLAGAASAARGQWDLDNGPARRAIPVAAVTPSRTHWLLRPGYCTTTTARVLYYYY